MQIVESKKPFAPPPMSRADKMFLRMFREDARCAQDGRCAYCRSQLSREDATGDHVKPRVYGGDTAKKNIKAACEDCNKLKGWRSEKAFLRAIKNPQPGDDIRIWLAWSRRRIALATERAVKRIRSMVE